MKSIEEALATFEESAIIQGQTQETGDYKKGNRYHMHSRVGSAVHSTYTVEK